MLTYIPLVVLGVFVFRWFTKTPEKQDKETQTHPWTGLQVLDLMEFETDSSDTWEGYFNSDCSSGQLEDKKDV